MEIINKAQMYNKQWRKVLKLHIMYINNSEKYALYIKLIIKRVLTKECIQLTMFSVEVPSFKIPTK